MQFRMRAITLMIAMAVVCLTAWAKGYEDVPDTPGLWRQLTGKNACEQACQDQLKQHLIRLTGWQDWQFTEAGELVVLDNTQIKGGSAVARHWFRTVWERPDIFWIEDHSGSPSVNFGQLNEGLSYFDEKTGRRCSVWRVRLDFNDFRQAEAPRIVRETFDPGFTLLHELLHGLGHRDAHSFEDVGECEAVVNEVRGELGLPLRARYFAEALLQVRNVTTARLLFQRLTPEGKRRNEWLFFRPGSETIVSDSSSGMTADAVAARRR